MLRLTKKADYSLIALKHFALANGKEDGAVSAKEVADAVRHSSSVLVQALAKAWKERIFDFRVSEPTVATGWRAIRDEFRPLK